MSTNARNLAERIQTLSAEQAAKVEDFIDFLSFRARERELTRTASAASEPAFASIWSDPEDTVCDAL
jgi:hypothetical protein